LTLAGAFLLWLVWILREAYHQRGD